VWQLAVGEQQRVEIIKALYRGANFIILDEPTAAHPAGAELVLGPNRTIIPPGGLLVSLSYPAPLPGSRSVFLKLGRRDAMAISRLTVAALGRLDDAGRVAEARLVPGSATPHIYRFRPVEESLMGQKPEPALYQAAARLAADEMTRRTGRRWSSEFKEPVLIALTARALAHVFEPEPNGRPV
jgi:CO/xanthine dehydrogenase FAD-binding subunit